MQWKGFMGTFSPGKKDGTSRVQKLLCSVRCSLHECCLCKNILSARRQIKDLNFLWYPSISKSCTYNDLESSRSCSHVFIFPLLTYTRVPRFTRRICALVLQNLRDCSWHKRNHLNHVPSVSTGAQITYRCKLMQNKRKKRQETKQLQIKTNPKLPKIQSFLVPAERLKIIHWTHGDLGGWSKPDKNWSNESLQRPLHVSLVNFHLYDICWGYSVQPQLPLGFWGWDSSHLTCNLLLF